MRASKEKGKLKRFQCPTCRISVPATKCTVYDFPKDFRIVKLRDAIQGVKLQRMQNCDICADASNSESYCVDCEKYFCQRCNARHQTNSVSASHVTITTYPGRLSSQTACDEHEKERVKFFCESCNQAICVSCMFGRHADHEISNLNESLESKREELRGCLNHLRSQLFLLQDSMFHLTCMEGKFKGEYEEEKLKIKKNAQVRVGKIHAEEMKDLTHLDQSYHFQYDCMSRKKDQCRSYIKHFSSLQARLESVLKVNDVRKVASSYKDVLHDIQQVKISDEHRNNLLKPPRLPSYSPGLESPFARQESCSTSTNDAVRVEHTDFNAFQSDVFSRSCMIYRSPTIESVAKICAKLLYQVGGCGRNLSQLCLPYGVVFLEDESLMVAENGNSRLQIFDKLTHTKKMVTLMTCIPRCITALSDDKFAVADELGKCVKIIDIFNENVHAIASESLAFPFGIACLPDDNLVVSDMIFENISIITPDGGKVHEFGSHGNDNEKFDNPSYIATDCHGNIFVSDSGHHEIKVFDSMGELQFKFGGYGTGDGQLKYPKGVALDSNGTIYVADAGNDRVVVFSRLGFYQSTLLDRNYGIERPTGLAYHPAGLLAVSMPDKHKVSVFQLVNTPISVCQRPHSC
ncbi:hypothetical protein FSP39_012485 [Pinctada imbricata]|uniref:B box-type domain-containing protein n=1 Tax=Pinctada imbricata TaxID=66713 RepID=A0AA89BR40_PINIB|nr:hypothetical protein FSP39_012485 [Pinctada imbricata]